MKLYQILTLSLLFCFSLKGNSAEINEILPVINRAVSGERAREYTMRLWQYDKWSTLPMWKKSAAEAHKIMVERGFDEAKVVDTPADGVTQYGTWTNPVGWDVKQATLEVIEPSNLPDEYRYLCDFLDNPTSLTYFSCPTPQEGIETELVLLENSNQESLSQLDARGKIILVSSQSGGMKRFLDQNGVLGIVSDEIERHNRDFITANTWLNTWSDQPGGWLMNAADSKNNFCFSISQKKGAYLRNLLRQGRTVKVRAKIDSRYYTDDTFPYVEGCIRGDGSEGEEVLIVGHMFEWGANDNSTGCASILEAIGTLNDLIASGALPRPKRTIRAWMGQEIFGSMAFAVHNLDRLRNKTIAAVCCDTPAEDYDSASTAFSVAMNFNASPSFTDAVFPEIAQQFHNRYAPYKLWKTVPYITGIDDFFSDPMIGVPINAVSMGNGNHLHHNSMDTIEKVDPRTLQDLTVLNAVYLYYMADADYEDIEFLTQLTYDRTIRSIADKSQEMNSRLLNEHDGSTLGRLLSDGVRTIEYYTGLQNDALRGIERIVPSDKKQAARDYLAVYEQNIEDFGSLMTEQFTRAVRQKSAAESISVIPYVKQEGDWEKEAATIIPKRAHIGTLTLDGIPVEEWKEVRSSPRWWSPGDWAVASYWWCDGRRNLNEIKELLELEAGRTVRNFDLITYYRFLEQYGMVEFVK